MTLEYQPEIRVIFPPNVSLHRRKVRKPNNYRRPYLGRVLGHADHASTMRYSHLANGTLLAAAEAGAAGMGGGTPQL